MGNLRDRARGGGSEVAISEQERAYQLETRNRIASMEQAFAAALPEGVRPQQIIGDALQVLQATPALYRVQRLTLLGALVTCSQLALRPGVLGQAYVLPFKGRAQFVAGYHGLKDIAHRSQQIRDVDAQPVREADVFDFERGSRPAIHHKVNPRLSLEDRGPIFGYYAVVTTVQGGTYLDYMTVGELEEHRDRFALQRDKQTGKIKGPWIENPVPMAQKTVLKRALKLAPRSLEMQAVQLHDESVRRDLRLLDLGSASRTEDGEVAWPTEGPPDTGGEDVADGEVVDAELYDPTDQEGFGTEGFRG